MADPTPDDVYRAAAEAYEASRATLWGHDARPFPEEVAGRVLDRDLRAAVDAVRPLFEAAGRESERDHLRGWVNTELRDIADYPDVTSGDAIWQESGYVQALRDVLAEIDGRSSDARRGR